MKTILIAVAIAMLTGCATRKLQNIPTEAVVAAMIQDGDRARFAACRVYLDSLWDRFEKLCPAPMFSTPWGLIDGRCHFYETRAVGIITGTAAPYIAICESSQVFGDPVDARKRLEGRVIQLVVGLRQIPPATEPVKL